MAMLNNQMVTFTTNHTKIFTSTNSASYDQLPRLPRYSWREDAIISVGCTLKARAKYRKKSGRIEKFYRKKIGQNQQSIG